MNFNENKYKGMIGPTAQSKIAKVLNRKGRNTAMSVDRVDLQPYLQTSVNKNEVFSWFYVIEREEISRTN